MDEDKHNHEEEEQLTDEQLAELAEGTFLKEFEGNVLKLLASWRLTNRRFHKPTAEHNPDKKKGRGYTKAPYNFLLEKKRRKIAKASKKRNR